MIYLSDCICLTLLVPAGSTVNTTAHIATSVIGGFEKV